MEKEYIVTLYKTEDLEGFYEDMEEAGIKLKLKRPMSRNTHYLMTVEQANEIKKDSRVWGVDLVEEIVSSICSVVNNSPYSISGNFWKDDTEQPYEASNADYQWGHVHCAGDENQRGKGFFGSKNTGGTTERKNTEVEIFNDGKHVDVIIIDDGCSYDCGEWTSPTTNNSRFVQYQWYENLNNKVDDDDGAGLPSGPIEYYNNEQSPTYHGIHVMGTAVGRHYGWAKEANIYAITGPDGSNFKTGAAPGPLLCFDYIRAFHANKPINPETGFKNPTIVNNSWELNIYMPQKGVDGNGNPIYRLDFEDVTAVVYRGNQYAPSGTLYHDSAVGETPSGADWSQEALENEFGIKFGVPSYPNNYPSVTSDIQQCIDEGIVIVSAAGNSDVLIAQPGDADWGNVIATEGVNFNYCRGGTLSSPDSGAIIVGALSNNHDFRKAPFSNYGPAIDVFAPGEAILSSFNKTGIPDSKYGTGNYFYPIQGTSMACPQVTGILACAATNKPRFTQDDARAYLNKTSIIGEMDFDMGGGGYDDPTRSKGSPNSMVYCANIKPTSGFLEINKGSRQLFGQTFPRRNKLNKA